MLPLYKLLSLFLRVFSRPLINLTKRYHANNEIKTDWVRRYFLRMGTWFHKFQSRINRKYLKTDTNNIIIKPISEPNAVDKGIQFFYQILFYSIAVGFPLYEIYRQVVDSKAKDKKLSNRVEKIRSKITSIKGQVEKVSEILLQSGWEERHIAMQMANQYLLFCYSPINQQLSFAQELTHKYAAWLNIPPKLCLYQ